MGGATSSGSGDRTSTTGTTMGTGSGADVGRDSPTPDAVSSSPGADPGSGLGGDEEFNTDGVREPLSQQGIAGRSSQEGTPREGADDPSGVPADEQTGSTPGHTP